MFLHLSVARSGVTAFSLTEVLVVVSVIGVITALVIPGIGDFSDGAKETTARRNAQNLGRMSSNLATVGMEHVIPESLGGVEASCRLIKHGIVVDEGPLKDAYFAMPALGDDQIPLCAEYLVVTFHGYSVLRLRYETEPETETKKKK